MPPSLVPGVHDSKVSISFSKREAKFNTTACSGRDLWEKKDMGTTDTIYAGDVAAQDVVLLNLKPVK